MVNAKGLSDSKGLPLLFAVDGSSRLSPRVAVLLRVGRPTPRHHSYPVVERHLV